MKDKWLMVLGFIALLLVIANYVNAEQIDTSKLDEYYTLNGNAIDLINGHNGTITGATYNASGKLDGCYDFDGSGDYITADPIENINVASFSLSAWIKTSNSGNQHIIAGEEDGTNKFYMSINAGDIIFYVNDGGNVDQITYTGSLANNAWHHIVATKSGSGGAPMDIWVDGNNVTTSINSNGGAGTTIIGANLRIGEVSGSIPDHPFTGSIDEVGIWNKPINVTEITNLYNSGIGLAYPFSDTEDNLISPINNYELYNLSKLVNFRFNLSSVVSNVTNYTFRLNPSEYSISNSSFNLENIDVTIPYNFSTNKLYTWNVTYCLLNNACYNTSTYSLTVNSSKSITFRALDYLGNAISSVLHYATGSFIGGTIYNIGINYTTSISRFINDNSEEYNLTMNFTDMTYKNVNNATSFIIGNGSSVYSLKLSPVKLSLHFFQNGTTVKNTYGQICEDGTIDNLFGTYSCDEFTNTSFIQIQQDLEKGNINIKFNMNTTDNSDWVQYYEYYNNQTTVIEEDLDVLYFTNPTSLKLIYFKITDNQNRPIEDATIYATHAIPSVFENYTMMGRRLTESDGITSFYFDERSSVRLLITANGYEPTIVSLYPTDVSPEHDTVDTASRISLSKSTGSSNIGAWINAPTRFWDRTENIIIGMTAPDWNTIKYQTSYSLDIGNSQQEVLRTGIFGNQYYFTLQPGIDFSTSGTDDIVIIMEYDGINRHNITIEYFEKQSLFDFADVTISDDYIVIIGVMALIAISGAIGYWINSTTAGVTTFLFGGIILALIDSSFIWLGIINALWFILTMIKKVFKE